MNNKMSVQSLTVKENDINKVAIIQKRNEMLVKVPLRMTAAKLEVLNEVCKAEEMELAKLIEDSVNDMV